MMKKNTSILKLVILFFALFTGSQVIGQDLSYYTFLPNDAGDIDRDGFDIGYHAVFLQWDLNKDGDISETEFYTVIFRRLDSDNDGSLTSREWIPGEKYLFDPVLNNRKKKEGRNNFTNENGLNSDNSAFNSLDLNNDKLITFDEFDEGLRNRNYFSTYDSNQNGKLDREELNTGVYNHMDLDGNGIVAKAEFKTVKFLFLD